jgi:hypothetical protein
MERLSRAAAALSAAALLIAGGGAYALASSAGATITVCVNHNGGTLYKAKTCAARDKKLSWNEQGPPGIQGPTGKAGVNGTSVTSTAVPSGNASCPNGGSRFTAANGTTYVCNGARGPQGPGAITIDKTLTADDNWHTVATASGLTIEVFCPTSAFAYPVDFKVSGSSVQFSAFTGASGANVYSWHQTGGTSADLTGGDFFSETVSIIGRGSSDVPFSRFDIHADGGGSPCQLWGMITPSS